MAKGQVRSNREVRKPKKEKTSSSEAPANTIAGRFAPQTQFTAKPKK